VKHMTIRETSERIQSMGEEIANSISHGVGALFAAAAAPILVITALQRGEVTIVVGASVFAATMILLYFTSTLYHALPHSRAKKLFQILDHGAIFLLIAGTYTPFTLGVLEGTWGWMLFGLVWSLALIGIVMKATYGVRASRVSTIIYLLMGWSVLLFIEPLLEHLSPRGFFWLLAGGIFYTFGVVFYVIDGKVRYAHFIWHLFVIAGTACHFFAVLWHAL